MGKPVIALSCNYTFPDGQFSTGDLAAFRPRWHSLSENYVRSVEEAGGIPLLLPVYRDRRDLERALALADGVFLTGGNDLDPLRYGEVDRGLCGPIDPERDGQELHLVRYILERTDKPLLCVCRGMQVLNAALGGSLYQDLAGEGGFWPHMKRSYPMNAPSHTVTLEGDSLLFRIFRQETLAVNSFHHQGVRTPGAGLRVTARSEDGVAEALELPDRLFVLGVQWHPEKMYDSQQQKLLFSAFVAQCAAGR